MCTHNLCLSKNKNFQLKIFNFQSLKNICLLHGQVFIMNFGSQILGQLKITTLYTSDTTRFLTAQIDQMQHHTTHERMECADMEA